MSRNLLVRLLAVSVLLCAFFSLRAQDGTHSAYSPYSIYGIGNLDKGGSAFNMTKGGVGIATRTNRFVNYMNPASITARDSLSFMSDFGLKSDNAIYRQGDIKSGHNTFNINDFVISFPIYRSSAMMLGIAPYSSVGYNYNYPITDPGLIGNTGTLGYTASGSGSIYQMFIGGAVTFWKRLSLGAEYIYYFGKIEKNVDLLFSDDSFRSISGGYNLQLKSSSAKFGLQYEQPLGKNNSMVIGATYKLRSNLNGFINDHEYASISSVSDTLKNTTDTLSLSHKAKLASEIGVGIAFRNRDRWSVEFNYLYSDWRNCGFDSVAGLSNDSSAGFSAGRSHSFRAGFEITPNRNDIRYKYKTFTYRAGAYYDREYYLLGGAAVDAFGLTFGMTIPVSSGYNGFTFGVDIGQRGNVGNNRIRERYIGFNIGFNIFDIWFRKHRYE